jgi:hypothetical protein
VHDVVAHVTLRVRGLRLVTTDIDWAFGRGREVDGPGRVPDFSREGRTAVDPILG